MAARDTVVYPPLCHSLIRWTIRSFKPDEAMLLVGVVYSLLLIANQPHGWFFEFAAVTRSPHTPFPPQSALEQGHF